MLNIIDQIKLKLFPGKYSIVILKKNNKHIKVQLSTNKLSAKIDGTDGYLLIPGQHYFHGSSTVYIFDQGIAKPDYKDTNTDTLTVQDKYLGSKFADMWRLGGTDDFMQWLPWIIAIVAIVVVIMVKR